jgi:hypothetical protein
MAALTKAHRGGGYGEFGQFHPHHDHTTEDTAGSAAGLPEMPIVRHQFRGEAADAEQLLAVLEVWRRVQPGAAVGRVATRVAAVNDPSTPIDALTQTVLQLTDLITALDRRLPQVQRSGEAAIANAAVRLRTEAQKRITELEGEIAGRAANAARPATY